LDILQFILQNFEAKKARSLCWWTEGFPQKFCYCSRGL